ncbi:MAG: co-chaperone GroES [Planctomycetota bacterium]|nr:MAG: co-chaperone GroES [Planctomycetota bacterium]
MGLKLRPLDDYVVIEPIEEEERTPEGIVLPDVAKEKPQKGKVVAVGPGKLLKNGKRAAMSVKEGDTVLYGKYAGTEVKIGDKEFNIMRESEILAVIED